MEYNKQECSNAKQEEEPVLEKIDRSLAKELEIYDNLVSNINSRIDKFKCIPESPCKNDGELKAKDSQEYFYTLNRKIETLSSLNNKLELVLRRLVEIL